MKKIKIMLAAIAVVAVVGGALAFKAKKQSRIYCSDANTTWCNVPLDKYTIVNAPGLPQSNCTIQATTTDCALTSTFFDN